jgi:hypothetical protein
MAFDWSTIIAPSINALGTAYAANQAAGNATASANQAAQMAQFRPVGVTTRFVVQALTTALKVNSLVQAIK